MSPLNPQWLHIVLNVFLPGYGLLVSGIMVIVCRFSRPSHSSDHYLHEITNVPASQWKALQPHGTDKKMRNLIHSQARNDIFKSPYTELKKRAIHQLEERPSAESIRLLQSIMQESDSEIKKLATYTLDKCENYLHQHIAHYEEALREHPESVSCRTQLTRLRLRYVESDLLDASTRERYLHLAKDTLTHLPYASNRSLLLQQHYYRALGNHAREIESLKAILDRCPHHKASKDRLAELYFSHREFAELGNLINST